MKRTISLFATLLTTLCACSVDTSMADQVVPIFHSELDAGHFAAIYDASADDLKRLGSEKDFVALLEAVHRKLGASKSSEKQSWNVNYHTSGTFVTLTYKTTYERGEAMEQFVFHIQGKSALLAGYHISSNALVLN
jgi:hypothetical protein